MHRRLTYLIIIAFALIHTACDEEDVQPDIGCLPIIDYGFIELAEVQDDFVAYNRASEIVFKNAIGEEVVFTPESSIDSIVELDFNAECQDDSLQLINVTMQYQYLLDIFVCEELNLRIGQYRYTTIQFNSMFELDPNDPLNPFSVVGINIVDADRPYFTFEGCWYNWALDNLGINNSLSAGTTQEVNGIQYDNVQFSQFCPNGSFRFVPGTGIVTFELQGAEWFFDRLQ